MGKFKVIDHPLIQHKLTMIRDKNCGTKVFREVVNEIAMLIVEPHGRHHHPGPRRQ